MYVQSHIILKLPVKGSRTCSGQQKAEGAGSKQPKPTEHLGEDEQQLGGDAIILPDGSSRPNSG